MGSLARSGGFRPGTLFLLTAGPLWMGGMGMPLSPWGWGRLILLIRRCLMTVRRRFGLGLRRRGRSNRLGDISHAVERSVRGAGQYGLIREYTGHGIGTAMHMDPPVPNYGAAGQGPRLRAGMALAIEPMITRGGERTVELADGWTVVTLDGSRAAHFEHTVAITAAGPWVLTDLSERKVPPPDRVTSVAGGEPDAG